MLDGVYFLKQRLPFLHDSHATSEVREGNDGATHKTNTQLAEERERERDDVIPEAT